jgi:hypothetical protein
MVVENVLQAFQGAIHAFLISGDPEPGRRMPKRTCMRFQKPPKSARLQSARGLADQNFTSVLIRGYSS